MASTCASATRRASQTSSTARIRYSGNFRLGYSVPLVNTPRSSVNIRLSHKSHSAGCNTSKQLLWSGNHEPMIEPWMLERALQSCPHPGDSLKDIHSKPRRLDVHQQPSEPIQKHRPKKGRTFFSKRLLIQRESKIKTAQPKIKF